MAVSGDGNTAMSGGYADNSGAGAVWVWTRSGGVWTQQGNKLVGTGASGAANQGQWVSLSSTGNRAVVGGWADNSLAGAAWVWTRTGSTWNQTGNKLFGTGAIGNAQQGYFVAMSGDGRTALVGGNGDNGSAGATWVFFGPPPLPFTDSPLQAGVTRIKAVHVNELRQRINALRAQHPLPPYPYSEAVTTSTTIKASHVLEMRQALHEVYVIMLQPPPTYGTTPAPNGPILAAEIESLRTAVLAIGG